MKKSAFLTIKVEPELKKKVENMALKDRRSFANQASYLVELGIKVIEQQLKTEYAKYVLELRKNKNIENVYYCSVQTTGNLRHNGGDAKTGYTFIRYAGRNYVPQNCELPVLCAVQKSLKAVIHRIRWQYYRTAFWMPFLRFWLCKRLKNNENRLTRRLQAVNQAISTELETGLFTW